MLGIALGCIRLGYDEFCKLEYEEFEAIYNAYAEQRDADFKDEWQRMRLLAVITIQPHLGKRRVTPEKLLPFPWDKKSNDKAGPKMTPAQQRKRMAYLAEKLGDTI